MMSNGFAKFENDVDAVWKWRLMTFYSRIRDRVERHTGKRMECPVFELNSNNNSVWGSWNSGARVMKFSVKLIRNFEWGAIEHVMKHEVAHQIVSEIFKMDCDGVAHGEAWRRACDVVGIEPERCSSYGFLKDFKGSELSPMVSRVRKIMIHANDRGATKEEAEQFMRKAKELMLRHDIEMEQITGQDRVWVARPFGPLFDRFPGYMFDLGRLLREHYNVEYLRTYGPIRGGMIHRGRKKHYSRLELFGEPDKLDIAEYVGHALLNQASILYEQYKQKTPQERMEEGDYGKLSKKAYMEGLLGEFSDKLKKSKEEAKQKVGEEIGKERAKLENREYTVEDCAIVPAYNMELLKEMMGKRYPRMCSVGVSASRGAGWNGGKKDGSKLRLSKGVQQGGNSGRYLNA